MRLLILIAALGFTSMAAAHAQDTGYVVGNVSYSQSYAEDAETYGARDIERLLEELTEEVTQRLEDDGLLSNAGATIELVLLDAKPNRPTIEQLGDNPGLSYQSFSRGGANIQAIIRNQDGEEISQFQYDWYTPNIEDSAYRGTWSDADRAFSRFSRQLSRHLQGRTAS